MFKRLYYFTLAMSFLFWQSSVLFVKTVTITLVDGRKAQFTFKQPDNTVQINHYENGVRIEKI